jgi:hypothetical protein
MDKEDVTMLSVDFAIVHHANQYIITDGYQNREGLNDLVGAQAGGNSYLKVLELHQKYEIPFNLHVSGTLLEAILWHSPDFFRRLKDLWVQGLVDFIGSSYGQNIMRFFGPQHNFRQLNEELRLYREQFIVDPRYVKVFWPPERLWDTDRLAPVIADRQLLNEGYQYVLVDDRLFYPAANGSPSRKDFDRGRERSLSDFYPCRIARGGGLSALPISSLLRLNIPPRDNGNLERVEEFFRWLAERSPDAECDIIAIYGDDLEKSAGCCGWDSGGPAHYESFLKWLARNRWIRPVKLNIWAPAHCSSCQKTVDVGSYFEMSSLFGAGEGYENWYGDPKWDKYRNYYAWSEGKVTEASQKGGDPALLDLAWKHLLASAWETAWHTPPYGVHGGSSATNEPSPWIKAIASHSRHAAIIAEAASWMRHKDGKAHAYLVDMDNDGFEELVLESDVLFAVFSPACGGRLVYLFNVGGAEGKMTIGNPSDDWNWLEELNQYMEMPANHPGALTEAGHEDDRYEVSVSETGDEARAVLINKQDGSRAFGLEKSLRIAREGNEIEVTYRLPPDLPGLTIEFGLSPDYRSLLRSERGALKEYSSSGVRGYSHNGSSVWVRLEDPEKTVHDRDAGPRAIGHGVVIRVRALGSPFTVHVGTAMGTGKP